MGLFGESMCLPGLPLSKLDQQQEAKGLCVRNVMLDRVAWSPDPGQCMSKGLLNLLSIWRDLYPAW